MRNLEFIFNKSIREKSIVLDDLNYKNIKEEYSKSERDIDNIVNSILFEWNENLINSRKNERKQYEEIEKRRIDFKSNCIRLDKYLEVSIGEKINILLSENVEGDRDCKLLDYKINYLYNYITINVLYKDEEFKIKIVVDEIKIKNYEDFAKVYIYDKGSIKCRIKVFYNINTTNSVEEGHESGKLELSIAIPDYEKHKKNNPLEYNIRRVEGEINYNFYSKRIIKDKDKKEFCLAIYYNGGKEESSIELMGEMYCIDIHESNKIEYGRMHFFIFDRNKYYSNSIRKGEIVNLDVERKNKGIGIQMVNFFEDFLLENDIYISYGDILRKETEKEQEMLRRFYEEHNNYTIYGIDGMKFKKELKIK